MPCFLGRVAFFLSGTNNGAYRQAGSAMADGLDGFLSVKGFESAAAEDASLLVKKRRQGKILERWGSDCGGKEKDSSGMLELGVEV